MEVLFIASVAVVTADPPASRRLFIDALGLPLEGEGDGYYSSGSIPGSKHFGVWPLSEAAQACFGTPEWPADLPVPQASIEFEVADADAVQVGADELKEKGFTLLHEAHTEPWGQTASVKRGCDHRHLVRALNAFVARRNGRPTGRRFPRRLPSRRGATNSKAGANNSRAESPPCDSLG